MSSEPMIGHWASGEQIDIVGVPLIHTTPAFIGIGATRAFVAQNGGMFTADYVYARHDDDTWTYDLASVEETMPPTPPQIQGFGDDVRLPMMDRWGFSAHLEAEQRKREWAEVVK